VQTHDLVVIGAGPGGVSAAVQAKRLGVTPLLLDRTGGAGGLTLDAYRIENYPGVEPLPGRDFAARLAAHLRRFRVSLTQGDVRTIEHADGRFRLSLDDGVMAAKAVVVAVGTVPRKLHLKGAGHVLYSPRPAIASGHKEVFIVGGGEAALDFALSLSARRIEVKVLVRGQHLRARGRLVEMVSKCHDIEVWRDTRVVEIAQKRGALEVTLSSQSAVWTERVESVVAAVGREPGTTGMLRGLDVGPDKTVSTRVPGLFLVGDARWGSLGQAGMAVGDGLAAGMAVAELLGG
jgi:thioredoxin reductase (NADPH)